MFIYFLEYFEIKKIFIFFLKHFFNRNGTTDVRNLFQREAPCIMTALSPNGSRAAGILTCPFHLTS